MDAQLHLQLETRLFDSGMFSGHLKLLSLHQRQVLSHFVTPTASDDYIMVAMEREFRYTHTHIYTYLL